MIGMVISFNSYIFVCLCYMTKEKQASPFRVGWRSAMLIKCSLVFTRDAIIRENVENKAEPIIANIITNITSIRFQSIAAPTSTVNIYYNYLR